MSNGVADAPLQHHGERTGSERQQEVVARQWTVTHLQDEMRYIREVSAHGGNNQPGLQQRCERLGCFPAADGLCMLVSVYR